MAAMSDIQALLDIVLLLAHPSQYIAAVTAMDALRANQNLNDRTPHRLEWPSRSWQGITVLINRITPPHRDAHGPPSGFDLLLAGGSTRTASLKLPDFEATFEYLPGTVVLILAKFITHEVDHWNDGDRICYAQWLRQRTVVEGPLPVIEWCESDTVRANWRLLEKIGRN